MDPSSLSSPICVLHIRNGFLCYPEAMNEVSAKKKLHFLLLGAFFFLFFLVLSLEQRQWALGALMSFRRAITSKWPWLLTIVTSQQTQRSRLLSSCSFFFKSFVLVFCCQLAETASSAVFISWWHFCSIFLSRFKGWGEKKPARTKEDVEETEAVFFKFNWFWWFFFQYFWTKRFSFFLLNFQHTHTLFAHFTSHTHTHTLSLSFSFLKMMNFLIEWGTESRTCELTFTKMKPDTGLSPWAWIIVEASFKHETSVGCLVWRNINQLKGEKESRKKRVESFLRHSCKRVWKNPRSIRKFVPMLYTTKTWQQSLIAAVRVKKTKHFRQVSTQQQHKSEWDSFLGHRFLSWQKKLALFRFLMKLAGDSCFIKVIVFFNDFGQKEAF